MAVSYYADGELKIVFLTADTTIPDKVEEAFLYVNQRYDMDCEVSEDRTVIEAYGNERYSTSATEKLLELLTRSLRYRKAPRSISVVKIRLTGGTYLKTGSGRSRTVRSFTRIHKPQNIHNAVGLILRNVCAEYENIIVDIYCCQR